MLDNAINIFFNDVQIPNFVKVTDISYSMLPNLDASRDRTLFNERTITVSFVFLFNKIRSLAEINKFNEWLRGNNFEPSKLQLPGDDFHYIAKVTSAVDITGDMKSGGGNIVFTCYEPNRLKEDTTETFSINTHVLTYNGNTGTFPIIEITPTVGVSKLKISVKNAVYENFVELNGNMPANKKIVINMRTKKVTVDDVLKLNYMTLDSSFHKLMPGKNTYKIENLSGFSANIIYREEYL